MDTVCWKYLTCWSVGALDMLDELEDFVVSEVLDMLN